MMPDGLFQVWLIGKDICCKWEGGLFLLEGGEDFAQKNAVRQK